jgi:DNA end-binding protein Ku
MTARAMWKGAIHFGGMRVPVKFYAAVADKSIHFRLLHEKDQVPVKQAMVNPETDDVVAQSDAQYAYVTEDHDWVVLDEEDFDAIEPEASREIDILHFLPAGVIDHRWYLRPYYLGPDGDEASYGALIAALEQTGQEGVARWVMRKKTYVGALRLYRGYPVMVSLRHDGEVVSIDELKAPSGRKLDEKEQDMAAQLIDMLADDFDPAEYENSHRERILDLIETKRRGEDVKLTPIKQREPSDNVAEALEASLKRERKSA